MNAKNDIAIYDKRLSPGPWHKGLRRSAGRIEIKDVEGKLVAMANGWPEADANARVIAAAPELLTVLKILLSAVEKDHPGALCIKAGHEAIAKATGNGSGPVWGHP
ncbi:MAG: hypothetical protein WB992_04820 [Bryobacteraceae bacterium]